MLTWGERIAINSRSIHGGFVHLCRESVAQAQSKFRNGGISAEEFFTIHIPFRADIPGRQPKTAVALSRSVGTFIVEHAIHHIFSSKTIGAVERKGDTAVDLFATTKIALTFVCQFLEYQGGVIHLIATIILDAVATERCGSAQCMARFCKSKAFHVVLFERFFIVHGDAHQPTVECGFILIEQTTLRNTHLWQQFGMIFIAHQIDVLKRHLRRFVSTHSCHEITLSIHAV